MSYTKTGNPVELLHVVKNCITSVLLYGKTTQSGTGDPSPTNIRTISGISASISVSGTVYAPSVPIKLYGQNEVYDTWEPCVLVDGVLRSRQTQRFGCSVLDGTENIVLHSVSASGYAHFYFPYGAYGEIKACSHYQNKSLWATPNTIYFDTSLNRVYATITDYTTTDTWKSYLAAQKSAGTPVTIVYQLATPIVTLGDPYTIPNVAGNVTISAENTLEVTVGVMSEEVDPPTPLSKPMVNGKLFSEYGGAMLFDYTVGGTEITNDYFKGRNRSSWNQLSTVFGMRSINLSILFTGPDLNRVTLQKSQFDAACFGQIELFLPDGFFYTANTVSVGDSSIVGIGETQAAIKADYSFEGIRHSPLVTATLPAGGGTVYCQSTLPFTDCILSCTVTAPATSYVLGGATFKNVQAGETLVFDGINKRILRGGAPGANNVNWTVFPQLIPGANNLTCVDAATVQYYPVYM